MRAIPKGYLACKDVELHIDGRIFPITFDLFGRRVPAVGQVTDCVVIDRVMLEQNDVTVEIPSEAFEVLTAHVNALPVKP